METDKNASRTTANNGGTPKRATVSDQTMNFINCIKKMDELFDAVYDAVEFEYGADKVDTIMDEGYTEKHVELKNVIFSFLNNSIFEIMSYTDRPNEI